MTRIIDKENEHLIVVGVVFVVCLWIIWTTDEFDDCFLRG